MDNQIRVKIRPYKLNCSYIEFGNPSGSNRLDIEKTDTLPNLNICVDRDIYLSLDAKDELENILSGHTGEIINSQTIVSAESEILLFIKNCFADGRASFEAPTGMFFKIAHDLLFEHY